MTALDRKTLTVPHASLQSLGSSRRNVPALPFVDEMDARAAMERCRQAVQRAFSDEAIVQEILKRSRSHSPSGARCGV